jgi:hypothetical protein
MGRLARDSADGRPEEVHGAASEDDVVPPVGGWDEAVEEQALVVRSLWDSKEAAFDFFSDELRVRVTDL